MDTNENDGSKKVLALASALLDADPNIAQSIEYRIAAMRVAIATLEADQSRRIQLAMLARALR